MKTKERNLFKAQNLALQDVNGIELNFTDTDPDASIPSVGDEVVVDGEYNVTGEYFMHGGAIIAVTKGKVTKVTNPEDDDYDEVLDKHLEKMEEALEAMDRQLKMPKQLAMFRDRKKGKILSRKPKN